MNKIIFSALALSFVGAANATLLYQRIVETGSRYGGGGANVITFDDIPVAAATMGVNTDFKLNQVKVGIRRLAGSSINTVNVWAAAMDNAGNLFGAPVNIGTFNLAARTTSATEVLTMSGLTQTILGNKYAIGPSLVSMYIGVQQTATDGLQGWRITSGASANSNYFMDYDTTALTQSFFNFGTSAPASFYAELDATPVPEPGSLLALGLGAVAMMRRRKS